MAKKYHSDKDLSERYRTSRQTIWRWVRERRFPKPIKLSPGCSRWDDDDILAHEAKLAAEKGAQAAAIEATRDLGKITNLKSDGEGAQ